MLSKDAETLLEISIFFMYYSHIFTIANQFPGFSISILANVDDFFFKCKYI